MIIGIIRGMKYSGKTTLCQALRDQYGYAVVDGPGILAYHNSFGAHPLKPRESSNDVVTVPVLDHIANDAIMKYRFGSEPGVVVDFPYDGEMECKYLSNDVHTMCRVEVLTLKPGLATIIARVKKNDLDIDSGDALITRYNGMKNLDNGAAIMTDHYGTMADLAKQVHDVLQDADGFHKRMGAYFELAGDQPANDDKPVPVAAPKKGKKKA